MKDMEQDADVDDGAAAGDDGATSGGVGGDGSRESLPPVMMLVLTR